MDISYWEKESYFGNVDLLIIGSGIVGLNAALNYKTRFPKTNVLVCERGLLPQGASTKNAGFACFGSISELADDLAHIPEKIVWETVSLRFKGLQKLKSIIGEKNMDYYPLGGYEVFDTKEQFESCRQLIRKYNTAMQESIGLKNVYSIVPKKITQSGLHGFRFCIKNQYEGQINTGKMMTTLLQKTLKKGVRILNGFGVNQLHDNVKNVETTFTNGLVVPSKKVIIATNGFARQLLPQLHVKPARAQVIVTSKINNLKLKGAFHYQEGYYYFRNINGRILLGGGRNLNFLEEETTQFGLTTLVQEKLEKILAENILPGTPHTIEHRWSGIMGIGSEKKPIIKHVSPNVVCAVRMGGMGIAIGSLVGQMAVNELVK